METSYNCKKLEIFFYLKNLEFCIYFFVKFSSNFCWKFQVSSSKNDWVIYWVGTTPCKNRKILKNVDYFRIVGENLKFVARKMAYFLE